MRDVLAITFYTIAFLALTGFYGFMKFTYQNRIIEHLRVVINEDGSVRQICTTPINSGHDRNLLPGHQHPAVKDLITYSYTESPSSRDNLVFFS
ncbi:hypothetical protein GGR54DRAFT_635533 [Hypoxylon sp. NC1633]|nr:hypothetical protein GGR54DRAFT_635533 [Hypoxylon sp. NC1633]